jgi:hypothetical protein
MPIKWLASPLCMSVVTSCYPTYKGLLIYCFIVGRLVITVAARYNAWFLAVRKLRSWLRSVIWTLSIVFMFFNHNVSRDGSSLVIRWNLLCWVRSIELASVGGHLEMNWNHGLQSHAMYGCVHVFLYMRCAVLCWYRPCDGPIPRPRSPAKRWNRLEKLTENSPKRPKFPVSCSAYVVAYIRPKTNGLR